MDTATTTNPVDPAASAAGAANVITTAAATATAPDAKAVPDAAAVKPGGYRPEGLADHLVGATDQETIDKLAKAYEGFREEKAKGVPKTPDDYNVSLPEEAAKLFGPDLKADPVMTKLRAQAHAAGLKGAQFEQFIAGAVTDLAALGVVSPAIDAKADFEALRGQLRDLGRDHSDAAVNAEIKAMNDWVDVFGKQANLDAPTIEAMKAFVDVPDGHKVLRAIQARLGQSPIAMGGAPAPANWTKDTLRAAQADPRYDPSSRQFDPAFQASVDEGYKRVYG